MSFLCLKDLAALMQLSPRSVKRWAARLNVPPTVPGQSSQRWSRKDARKLLKSWQAYWQDRRPSNPEPRPLNGTH